LRFVVFELPGFEVENHDANPRSHRRLVATASCARLNPKPVTLLPKKAASGKRRDQPRGIIADLVDRLRLGRATF
jgi:hypothetical protein